MASITCGNCKNTHESVAAVRSCHTNTVEAVAILTAKLDQPAAYDYKVDGFVQPGIYKNANGTLYKVETSKKDPEKRYAKIGIIKPGHKKIWWNYQAGAICQLTPAMRLSLNEAEEISAKFGYCMLCGRTLTATVNGVTPDKRYVGPICAGKI